MSDVWTTGHWAARCSSLRADKGVGQDLTLAERSEGWRIGVGDEAWRVKFARQRDAEIAAATLNRLGVTLDQFKAMPINEKKRVACEHLQW